MPSPPLLRPRPETDEEEDPDPAEEDDEGAVGIVGAADVKRENIIATKKNAHTYVQVQLEQMIHVNCVT